MEGFGPANGFAGGLCVPVCAAGWEPRSEGDEGLLAPLSSRNKQLFDTPACGTGRSFMFPVWFFTGLAHDMSCC